MYLHFKEYGWLYRQTIDQWNTYNVHRTTCKHASVDYLYIIYAMWNKFVWRNSWQTPAGERQTPAGEKNEQFTDFAIHIFEVLNFRKWPLL